MNFENIMNKILPILPVLLTGLITFLITKYTVNKNIPLDKIEKAYNRIYYPMYKLIRESDIDSINQTTLQEKMNYILLKYDKYVSQSTRNVYLIYLKSYRSQNRRSKKCLEKFCNNIIEYNAKYRRLLGYPQADFWEAWRYLSVKNKRIIISYMGLMVVYILTILYQYLLYQILIDAIFCVTAFGILYLLYILIINAVNYIINFLVDKRN